MIELWTQRHPTIESLIVGPSGAVSAIRLPFRGRGPSNRIHHMCIAGEAWLLLAETLYTTYMD